MSSTPRHWVLLASGAALALTGLAKVLSAVVPAPALTVPDPLFGIPFHRLLAVVGVAELLIAYFCLFTEKCQFSLLAVAWLATSFVAYRLGLWFMGWHRPCGCLGSLTALLHIPTGVADNIMKVVLAFLLIGSYTTLVRRWTQEKRLSGGTGQQPSLPQTPRAVAPVPQPRTDSGLAAKEQG